MMKSTPRLGGRREPAFDLKGGRGGLGTAPLVSVGGRKAGLFGWFELYRGLAVGECGGLELSKGAGVSRSAIVG